MQTLYRATDLIDAQRVVDLLAAEGIEAHVQGGYLSGAIGELPLGEMVRVWVQDADLARARQVVDAAGADARGAAMVDDGQAADADAAPEAGAAAAAAQRGRGIPNGWVGLVFGLALGFGAAYWLLRLPHVDDAVDFDHDGTIDVTYEYQGQWLARTLEDRDGDGQVDQVVHDPEDGGGWMESDDDFDGRFESRMRFARNQPVALETDVDGDGAYEQQWTYTHGVPTQVSHRDADGTEFKRETYRGGHLVRAELDADRDGRFEIERKFDAAGEVVP